MRIILSLLTLAVAAQAQESTFRGNVRTVAIYATVMGADGRFVPDLARDTFTVLDNGRRQELTLFANDIQPITVVMLLDRSGSMKANFSLVQRAAERFVDVMLPADKARIGSFSNRIQIDPRDFTSDHEELHRILRTELQEEGPTPLWNAVNVGITALLHQQGRRVILVFTDGMDEPFPGQSNNSLKDVMKRAEEEDVMVYAIGLNPSDPYASAGGGPQGRFGRGGFGGRPGFGGRFGGGPGGGRRPVADHPDEGLPKIATSTGGGYFELTSTSDLAATFAKVADELHRQYALGFTPEKLDGKMHTLDVRAAGAGLTVRARRSYLAKAAG
ncbi:MAG TPA: VWA domain-containing protein [Vicinamibacterales bacterium]|nr:VWA domain-containing protein [Vicinamibacterales bacterium]